MAMGCRTSLLMFDELPHDLRVYLQNHGYHFSKAAFEFAVSKMKRKNPSNNRMEPVQAKSKDEVMEIMRRNAVTPESDEWYDMAYTYSMAMADFWGTSLTSETQVAKFVKDYVDDPDMKDGGVFVKWYACALLNGINIEWSDLL